MTTGVLVSLEDYLNSSSDPDCDYVDGELLERNVGEYDHGRLQAALLICFGALEKTHGIRAVPEQRIQVSPSRFRVPDVCVILGKPHEQVLTHPPFLCVEILSPEDRMGRMLEKIREYVAFGVSFIWLIDPQQRKVYMCDSDGGLRQAPDGILRTTSPDIQLHASHLFGYLDD